MLDAEYEREEGRDRLSTFKQMAAQIRASGKGFWGNTREYPLETFLEEEL